MILDECWAVVYFLEDATLIPVATERGLETVAGLSVLEEMFEGECSYDR